MATKNEPFSIEGTNDPSYLGYSHVISPGSPNHAWGSLFEGIGKLAASGANATATIIEDKIGDEARAAVDSRNSPYTDLTSEEARKLGQGGMKKPALSAVSDGSVSPDLDTPGGADDAGDAKGFTQEQGAGPGSLFARPSGTDAPPRVQFEIDTAYGNLERLYQGRAAGTVTPQYFDQQLVSIQKRLRARYPGFEDVVDRKLHQLTGVIPGNQQVQSTWAAFKAMEAANSSGDTKWETWMNQNAKYIGPAGMKEAQQARGNQDWQDNIKQRWAGVVQGKENLSHLIQTAEYEAKNRTATKASAEGKLTLAASTLMGTVLAREEAILVGQTKGKIKSYHDLVTNMASLNEGKGPNPEQKVAFQASMANLEASYIRAYNEIASSEGFAQADPGTRTALLNQNLEYIRTISKQIDQGGFQLASIVANELKHTKESTAVGLMRQSKWVSTVGGLNLVDSNFFQNWLSVNGDMEVGKDSKGKPISLNTHFFQTIRSEIVKAGTGTGSLKDFANTVDPSTGQRMPPEYVLDGINKVKKILADPKASPQIKANAAEWLSGPGAASFTAELNSSEKLKAVGILSDPNTTEEIYNRFGAASPQWTKYRDFTISNLMSGVQEQVASVREALNDPKTGVTFNPETSQFTNPKTYGKETPTLRGMQTIQVPSVHSQKITELNTALATVGGILEKEGKKEQLNTMLLQLGLLPDGDAANALDRPTGAQGNPAGALKLSPGEEGTGGGLKRTEEPVNPGKSVMDYAKGGRLMPNQATIGPEWGNPFAENFSQHLSQVKTASGKNATVNRVASEAFQGLINDLESKGYKIETIGGFDMRANKSNPSKLSQHALGNAIDINAKTNAYGQSKTDLPKDISALARKWGLSWGGDWESVKDPMHFEFSGLPKGGKK